MTAIFTGAVHVTVFIGSILSSSGMTVHKLTYKQTNVKLDHYQSNTTLIIRYFTAFLSPTQPCSTRWFALQLLAGSGHVTQVSANQSRALLTQYSRKPIRSHLTTVVRKWGNDVDPPTKSGIYNNRMCILTTLQDKNYKNVAFFKRKILG